MYEYESDYWGFNTASGKHCCNCLEAKYYRDDIIAGFNTASGKHCCNLTRNNSGQLSESAGFNTASGKHCCNYHENRKRYCTSNKFQYRKR